MLAKEVCLEPISEIHREKLNEGITLFVAPKKVVKWPEFIDNYPPFSIALDGFVFGRPQFSPNGPHGSFNHHEEVDRLGTRATCSQVLVALKQGLLDTFCINAQPLVNIFVNDPDHDTALSVWLLKNHSRITSPRREPLIHRLVRLEDLLDVTAGAYPIDPNSEVLQEISWIFEPYANARSAGKIFQMSGREMAQLISNVGDRITEYSYGRGSKIELDTTYEQIGGGKNWKMIREIGSHARTAVYSDGIRAFVSVRENEDSSFTYSIGKMSPYVNFPITDLYTFLNYAEGLVSESANSWGGSDIIGGSPRMTGSKLNPKELEQIINRIISI